MYRSIEIFLLGFCLLVVNCERVRYDNYRVYKITPATKEHIKLLENLSGNSDSLIFLNAPHQVNDDVDVVVAPHKVNDFEQGLLQNSVAFTLVETNAQSKLENDKTIRPRDGSYNWKTYHTLEETYAWMDQLASKYPHVEIIIAGKSYEGREIKGVKVSLKSGNKGIFVEGGIHAREWIAPATTTYILNELLTSQDPEVRKLAENYDWYFIPHANPDGYVYTHTTNRLWRKTRSPNILWCYGTDPNRNWDFHWKEIGASSNPCSDTYAGKSAFSEIETKSLSDYIASLKGKINTYISFHSFSQLLLWPYGHSKEHTKNHNDLKQIGDASLKALANRYGTKYRGGNIYEAIYPAAGASVDWAYGVLDIPLSYCYELRPASGWNGFVLPEAQIIPTGEEIVDAIVALIKEAQILKYL